MGESKKVNTSGGSNINGDIDIGNDFIGRDKITINQQIQLLSPVALLIILISIGAVVAAVAIYITRTTKPETEIPLSVVETEPHLELAFLRDGNVWLSKVPNGIPVKLTDGRDTISFVWSFDGTKIATFNGQQICVRIVTIESSVDQPDPCINLEFSEIELNKFNQLIWSPNQQYFVMWNNSSEGYRDGWLIIDSFRPQSPLHIVAPSEWGMTPSDQGSDHDVEKIRGLTGEPIFLSNNTLIGTLMNESICPSGGCNYALFQFDLGTEEFTPSYFDIFDFSRIGRELAISANGKALINVGVFCAGVDFCSTYYNVIYMNNAMEEQEVISNRFENDVTISEPAISPDGIYVVIGQNWREPYQTAHCGKLGLNTAPMQVLEIKQLELGADNHWDLPPGSNPQWSNDGRYIAFESCLTKSGDAGWIPSDIEPLRIFVTRFINDRFDTIPVAEGILPSWRP